MSVNYRLVLEHVQNHVQMLFTASQKPELIYHNLRHTQDVVNAATLIANHYELSDRDFFVVVAAAWFHDIGYIETVAGHEQIGANKAASFLSDENVSEPDIDAIKNCIMATKLPQSPHNLLEEIVCDADLFHFGSDDFKDKSKLMRKECAAIHKKEIPKDYWRDKTIELMQLHHYHTEYARSLLNEQKQKNINALLEKQHKDAPEPAGNKLRITETVVKPVTSKKEDAEENKEQKKKKKDRPERGVETMFRISSTNHQRLSDMADNKAHIIITVNTITISAVATLLISKLDNNSILTIPALIFLIVSLTAIVFAILATRPQIPNGVFTQADIDEKKVNLLFFGNFYKMDLNTYREGMQKVMEDREFLYGTLIRDIYSQGIVLGRKYKLLRISYNVFMYGLIVSVIAFMIASLILSSSIY